MKPGKAPLEYTLVQCDRDHVPIEANSYAEKGWRVVTMLAITGARFCLLLERRKGEA